MGETTTRSPERMEFSGVSVCWGSGGVIAEVIAVAWVQSLAQELLHAPGAGEKKKKLKRSTQEKLGRHMYGSESKRKQDRY